MEITMTKHHILIFGLFGLTLSSLLASCSQEQGTMEMPPVTETTEMELPSVADDVIVRDDGSDSKLRGIFEAAPELAYERAELMLNPALSVMTVSSIAADKDGNFYIIHRGEDTDSIIVSNAEGEVLNTFGTGLFARAHTIRLDPAGDVWAVDSTSSMVYKFSPEGELLLEISVGNLPEPLTESCGTSDIAFADNGNVFISDGYCNARIVVYDADGNKVNEWGSPGDGPGEFNLPHAINMSPDGNVYVADRENGRVQWFTQDGEYLGEWHFGGRILSITFSQSGELFIGAEPKGATPMLEGNILQLDPQSGEVLGKTAGFAHGLDISLSGIVLAGSLTNDITIYNPR
jgi:DNA-binding beta-propeller fold protein YncE